MYVHVIHVYRYFSYSTVRHTAAFLKLSTNVCKHNIINLYLSNIRSESAINWQILRMSAFQNTL